MKQINAGLFNEFGFHLADEEMPDKANLPAVLRALDAWCATTSVSRWPSAGS